MSNERPSLRERLLLTGPAGPADPDTEVNTEIRRLIRGSAIGMTLLFGVCGAWASLTSITGAVITTGYVVAETNSRQVQHLVGGIVAQIAVKDGSEVKAGDLLIRLDATQVRSQLQILVTQIDELLLRQARLDAERLGQPELILPTVLAVRTGDPALQRTLSLEKIVLESRNRAFDGQRAQLEERINQTRREMEGYEGQLTARRQQLAIATREVTDLEPVFAKNLVPMQRMTNLRREISRIQGEIGAFISEQAKSRAKIAEMELQIIQLDQQRRSELTQEARDTASKLAEATEKRVVLEDQLNRIEIRSPVDGTVHQLAVFTIGGIVRSGETLMKIIPRDDQLTLEVRVQPRDIDQVHVGQPATVRIASANMPANRMMEGRVTTVSPDIVLEQATQQRYFVGRVAVDPAELAREGATKLQAGMPAEVFIRTESRSPLSYMLRPLLDQATRAFRER